MEYMVNNMENMHTDVRLKVLTICFVSIGDKKRRDVVQCIVQVPKYDFYIIASQKGIICQWSSKVFINTPSLLIFLWFFPIQCYSVSKRKTVFNVSVNAKFYSCLWSILRPFTLFQCLLWKACFLIGWLWSVPQYNHCIYQNFMEIVKNLY